jgi:hypothetical protein
MTHPVNDTDMVEAMFDVLWPLQDWNGEEEVCRAACRAILPLVEAHGERLWTPPEEAWGGLPRDLVMWLDMGDKTPRALFKHLERCGRPIPQWLRDEPEMQCLDHVPSKGTRSVLIYRAMLSAIRQIDITLSRGVVDG